MAAMYRASNYESRDTCILRMARKAFSTACNRRYSYRRKLKLELAQEDDCLRARRLKTTRRNGLIALDKRIGDLSLTEAALTAILGPSCRKPFSEICPDILMIDLRSFRGLM